MDLDVNPPQPMNIERQQPPQDNGSAPAIKRTLNETTLEQESQAALLQTNPQTKRQRLKLLKLLNYLLE